ncbi:Ubiquitinyl hydrolase 1 [Bertholletia excelsa]
MNKMGSRKTDVIEGRDEPPSNLLVKIQSFSSLQKAGIEKYSSEMFETGGYKWKLLIYPNGCKLREGEGQISMVLTLVETSSLPVGWEVNAVCNFFVFNRFLDKYVSFSSSRFRQIRRFHAMKSDWGIGKFIDLETFEDPSNGYLVDDACVFGVELFVIKQTSKGELLSVLKEAVTGEYSWKIKSFSIRTIEWYESDPFTVGDYKWKIRLYPNGNGEGKGNSISVFLCLDESTLPPNTKLLVSYTLRVLDMDRTRQKPENLEFKSENHFGPPYLAWGEQKLISLARLKDPKKRYLEDDTCIIQAQVTVIGEVSAAS